MTFHVSGNEPLLCHKNADPLTHPWYSVLDDSGLRPKFVNVSWSEHTTTKLNISQTTYNIVESGRTRIGRTWIVPTKWSINVHHLLSWPLFLSYFLVSRKRIGQFGHVMVAYQFPSRHTRRLDWRHKKLLELANFKRSCSTQLFERLQEHQDSRSQKKAKLANFQRGHRALSTEVLEETESKALKSSTKWKSFAETWKHSWSTFFGVSFLNTFSIKEDIWNKYKVQKVQNAFLLFPALCFAVCSVAPVGLPGRPSQPWATAASPSHGAVESSAGHRAADGCAGALSDVLRAAPRWRHWAEHRHI